jgi:hypothetical protein
MDRARQGEALSPEQVKARETLRRSILENRFNDVWDETDQQ